MGPMCPLLYLDFRIRLISNYLDYQLRCFKQTNLLRMSDFKGYMDEG